MHIHSSTLSLIFYTTFVRLPFTTSAACSHQGSASFFSFLQTRQRNPRSSSTPSAALFQPSIPGNRKRHKSFSTPSLFSTDTTTLKMVTMDSPSAHRNKEPIWSVLQSSVLPRLLPHPQGPAGSSNTESCSSTTHANNRVSPLTVLEVAAGCGVHTTFFASKLTEDHPFHFSALHWIATDPDPPSLQSLRERVREYQMATAAGSSTSSMDAVARNQCTFQILPMTLGNDGILEDNARDAIHKLQESLNLMICINMIHISAWSATVGLFRVAKESLCRGGILMTYGPYKQNGTAVPSNLAFDENLKARNSEWGVRDLERVQELGKECGMVLREKIEMPANNLCLIFQKE